MAGRVLVIGPLPPFFFLRSCGGCGGVAADAKAWTVRTYGQWAVKAVEAVEGGGRKGKKKECNADRKIETDENAERDKQECRQAGK